MTTATWVRGEGDLTPNQRSVIQLPTDRNQLILGPAGSGKTLLLLHRARRILVDGWASPEKVKVLVYTRVLGSYIEAGRRSLKLPDGIVETFYGWVYKLAQTHHIPRDRNDKADEDRFVKTLDRVDAYFADRPNSRLFDAILVDEGQDLPKQAFRLLKNVARHVTVFADYNQRLYEEGASLAEAMRELGINKEPPYLLQNLRNSETVAHLAAAFVGADGQDSYVKSQAVVKPPDQLRIPTLYIARNPGDEWNHLADVVRREIQGSRRIGILLPTNHLVSQVFHNLDEAEVECDLVYPRLAKEVDFNNLSPKLMSIHSSKGLTFDSVLLPHITSKEYTMHMSDALQLLFIGSARALDWVYMSVVDGKEPPEIKSILPLAKKGQLVIQRWDDKSRGGGAERPEYDIPL